jgi:histidine racemase
VLSIFTVHVANGNPTALVYDCPIKDRVKLVNKLLKKVEQVGFISKNSELPRMQMMGGELCINATLAFASTLKKKGILKTSGVKNPVEYINEKDQTTIKVPLEYEQKENIILFKGIGFVIFDKKEKSKITKTEIKRYSQKFKLPAFGAIIYKGNQIVPYVYVSSGVESFVKETACGSGSIAFSLFSGKNKVIQPTGKTILIKKGKLVEIKAKVTEIY